MDFRKIFFGFVILIFSNQVSAQMDSTDLDFYGDSLQIVTEQDSFFYSDPSLVELIVEFELSDTSINLEKIWVELIQEPTTKMPVLLSHNAYTLTELEQQNFLVGNTVTISFGIYSTLWNYEVVIRLEDEEGNQVRLITKTLMQ